MKTQKQRIASIHILGREPFQLPIVGENSKGFFCRTGPKDSPAVEWFAFSSDKVTSKEI